MQQHWKRLADGVELAVTQTDKFKTGLLAATLTIPLSADTATAGALIPEVLYRGSRPHPDMEKLSAATRGTPAQTPPSTSAWARTPPSRAARQAG